MYRDYAPLIVCSYTASLGTNNTTNFFNLGFSIQINGSFNYKTFQRYA